MWRGHRKGLETTTISVKLTTAELDGLDGERKRREQTNLWHRLNDFAETRGDAMRRLISEAAERRVEEKKRTDPRQVTLTEAIAAASDKTEQLDSASELPRKTGRRPRLRKTRRQVLPAGRASSRRSKSRIRG